MTTILFNWFIASFTAFFLALSHTFLFWLYSPSALFKVFSASICEFQYSSFFLSCSPYTSASHLALSISSSDILELEVIVIDCSLPVPRSLADTLTIPLASISNVTSICGTPAIALLIPLSLKLPKSLLSLVNLLSP